MAERRMHKSDGVVVLDADPDLGIGLDPNELERARPESLTTTFAAAERSWDAKQIAEQADSSWLGLLVLDGLMICQVTVGRRTACELLGTGDLLRPWDARTDYGPLPVRARLRVLRPARFAILDGDFAARMAPYPAVTARLLERFASRAHHIALTQAVTQLRRTDARLLILFWLLAERWGKVGVEGVRITLPLTHEVLAMLVGAHRPTVTLALARLSRAGLLTRERSDLWLMSSDAVALIGEPEEEQAVHELARAPD
jgi:CRP/FNR family transcriptional regulator, cyclic AMP receptor protein